MIRPPAIEFQGVSKRFGAVAANQAISFAAAAGSIHGIIGENGAGKSTLMHLLYGVHQPDSGQILLDGKPLLLTAPKAAIAAGIAMVHQHFLLVERFTVLDNILLGFEPRFRLAPSRQAARRRLQDLIARYSPSIDLDARIRDLPVGLRQRVEILKALYRGSRILILDEPTAVLTPDEAQQLFAVLRVLAAQGQTIFLITHKLAEIMAVTDRVTVLRQGRVVADVKTAETDVAQLGAAMLGQIPPALAIVSAPIPGPVVLAARQACWRDADGVWRLKPLDLDLRAGEILGVAGVSGNGQTELLMGLAGLLPLRGEIFWRDRPVPARRRAAWLRAQGLRHIPEDRLRQGLIAEFPAWETAILGQQRDTAWSNRWGFLRIGQIRRETRHRMIQGDIRPPDESLASGAFSGGNQQKLICARELTDPPAMLLAGQPTRGVDPGAARAIHQRFRELRAAGTAILLVSVELDEILALSDRILVMNAGAITGELPRHAADATNLGRLMAGLAAS